MKKVITHIFYGLLFLGLIMFSQVGFAQDTEPTDRPFPGAAATTVSGPTDRPFPGGAVTATERAFPTVPTITEAVTEEATALPATDAETTPELVLADIQATADAAQIQITQLEAQRDSLQAELEASQTDNGATTFALVIIVVGVFLALGVFFGLRRGEA